MKIDLNPLGMWGMSLIGCQMLTIWLYISRLKFDRVSFQNILEEPLYANKLVYQPPHAQT